MANKNMTRVEALSIAITTCENAEAREVIAKMIEQLQKPRKKPEGPSKARRDNERLAHELANAIAAKGEKVTPKWVTEHVRGILTPQKAVAVAKVGEELGILTKTKEGKVTYYDVA